MGASSQPGTVSSLEGAHPMTTVGTSAWITRLLADVTVQITIAGVGQVDTVVDVQVSNGPAAAPIPLDTPAAEITLTSASGSASDGFAITNPWRYVRFNVRSLSGTAAAVTGLIGA